MKKIRKVRVNWTIRPNTLKMLKKYKSESPLSESLIADFAIEAYLKARDKK